MARRPRGLTAASWFALLLWSVAAQAQPLGWRGDGSGQYPDAQPPLQWGPQQNVLWKTKLPSWSNATPAVVGRRILLCSEPSTLLCVSADDGAILWQRENDILDTLEPAKADEIRRLRQELAAIPRQIQDAEHKLRGLRQQLKEKPDSAEVADQVKTAAEQVVELKRQWAPVAAYDPPPTHGLTGYTSGTPVSDGTHVWMLLGNGVAACYDLDGNRRWIRFVDPSVLGYGHSSSPVLVGGKLILLHKDLVALDPASGAELWRTPSPARWGTPLPIRVGELDVVITPAGQAVHVADGKVLATGLPDLKYSSPVRHGDMLYFVDESVRAAYRIPQAPEPDGKLAFAEVWKIPQKHDRYYASPVLAGDLLYSLTQRSDLSAWNLQTGEPVLEQKADLGGGTIYPSPVLAGGHVMVGGDSGIVQVVKPGPQWEVVARNSLEPTRSTPVAVGPRLYIRGSTHLWCLQQP